MRGARAGRHALGRRVLALTAGTPRLLVLRALGLGDFLTGVPALRALRAAYPEHELVLAAPASLGPLARLSGAVDRLLDVHELEPLPASADRADLAVDLHGRGPQSHRILAATAPRRLVGFACPEAGHPGPAWSAEEHEVARWCRLVGEALGIRANPGDLRLAPPECPPISDGAVLVHPGAAYGARRWPAARFAAVAAWLTGQGCEVLVTGGPDEVELGEEVRRLAGLPDSAVVAGRTGLPRLAAQVAASRLVVCGDTGMAHLASAYGIPSVVLFGPTPPSAWGPPAEGPHRVLWHGDGAGDPWGADPDPALLRITVAEVLEACEEGLAFPGGPVRGASVIRGVSSAARTTPTSA